MLPFLHRMTPATMKENPLWLVVLCDMMTNLMLFFLVMYALTLQSPLKLQEFRRRFNAEELIDSRDVRAAEIIKQFREDDAALALKQLLRDKAEVIETERGIRVRLKDKLLFETARSELLERANKPLATLAQVLLEIPNEVLVEGHTDNVPITNGPYRTNWELSVARSYSVIERLELEGISPRRLIASGYGEWRPLAANATAPGRDANRRAEIVILRGRPRAGP